MDCFRYLVCFVLGAIIGWGVDHRVSVVQPHEHPDRKDIISDRPATEQVAKDITEIADVLFDVDATVEYKRGWEDCRKFIETHYAVLLGPT